MSAMVALCVVTVMLVGLILTIQWVHYPSFAYFDREGCNPSLHWPV